MKSGHREVKRNRGDLLLWFIVAGAIGVLALIFLTHNAWDGLQEHLSTTDYNTRRETIDRFVDRFDNGYKTVDAYFVPSVDVTGAANPVPAAGSASPSGGSAFVPGVAAANPPTHEFDTFYKDASGQPHFTAYYYNSAAQTISVYTYTSRTAAGVATGVSAAPIATYTDVVWFSASDLLNSQVPLVDTYVKQHYTEKGGVATDHLYNLGFPGVVGGDKGLQVYIATSTTNKSLAIGMSLKPHTNPRSETIAIAQAPLHAGMTANALTLTYINPLYPAQEVQTTDANYVGAFVPNMGTCSGIIDPLSTVGANAGPTATWLVTPLTPGSCTFTVKTSDGTESTTVTVVIGNYSPVVLTPAKLVYLNPEDTNPSAYNSVGDPIGTDPNGVGTATEAYDPLNLSVSNTCSGIANVTTTSSGPGALSTTAVATGVGTCSINYLDGHGGSGSTTVVVNQFAPLAVSPASFSNYPGATQTENVSEANYSHAFSYNLNDCAGYITVNGSAATGWVTIGNGPSSSFSIAAVNATTANCTVLVNDDHDNSGGSPVGPIAVSVAVLSDQYTLNVNPATGSNLTVGGSPATFVATAPETSGTNPTTSLQVGVTNVSGPCTVIPSGWQPSGTRFSVTPGTTAGNCNVTVAANPIANATVLNNTQTLVFAVLGVGVGGSGDSGACSTNCSVWYEYDNNSQVTLYNTLDHDSAFYWTETDTLTQYITTDGGNTWTTGNVCEYYSRNDVAGYYGDAYTYCNPANSDGTSTGSYSTGPVWPYTVAQMDNPSEQSFFFRANELLIQGQGSTPSSGGLCGETIISNWYSVAPLGIATLPFNAPAPLNQPLAPC